MFKLFGKKAPEHRQSVIVFDEAYCHSAGQDALARTYQIAKGTTEVLFRFPDFEAFWQTYVNKNPGLSNESLSALRDEKAVFVIEVIDGGPYTFLDGMDEDGQAVLNAGTLTPFGTDKPFTVFGRGALGIGLYHLGEFRTEILWATMYEAV
jgi:hypothetical protein